MRARCHRCHKPELTCICDAVPRVHNRTSIWVLQHKRERFHPIGTARIAELGLSRCRLDVVYDPPFHPRHVPDRCAVLYPGPTARPLAAAGAGEPPQTLIVLDGTWHHAHTLYRDHPWLRALPCYALAPSEHSRYRIRREPSGECLSTIEAIVHALRILEPGTPGLEGLLTAFDTMIDTQIRIAARRRHESNVNRGAER